MSNQNHVFHLVTPSPWPLCAALSTFSLTVGATMYFHSYKNGSLLLLFGFVLLLSYMSLWFRDVIREGTYLGDHTLKVQKGLRYGMALFIVSEVMFFFAFFWAFFHSSFAPTIELNAIWPPLGVSNLAFDFFKVPLLNTLILLLSGATITWAHHALVINNNNDTKKAFAWTILLALSFILCQAIEYLEAKFTISDSVYGSTFFMSTGFHGFHVMVGTVFIIVCYFRHSLGHFSKGHHFGFEAGAWYWHFVDVVWLFLVACVYVWGNSLTVGTYIGNFII